MPVSLRYYQEEAEGAARQVWRRGEAGALVHLPTGAGKTITALAVAVKAVQAGHRVLWLAHRRELISQPLEDVMALWPDVAPLCGTIRASQRELDRAMTFASIQSMHEGRAGEYLEHGAPRLVVVDEAHHSTAKTWRRLIERLDAAAEGRVFRLGLTATPERQDARHLKELWTLAYSYPLARALEDGVLVPWREVVERLPDLDATLDGVSGRDDYDDHELGAALILAGVVEHTAAAVRRHASDRLAMVFCATVEQARLTAEACGGAWLSGATPDAERKQIIEDFRAGRIRMVANCAVLTEGTNIPPADCVVLARPTRSRSLYIQMVGRGLRTWAGKEDCLLLDVCGASEQHSLITAATLDGSGEADCEHEVVDTRGICAQCGAKAQCPASPNRRHQWGGDGCRYCDAVQCPDSPTSVHDWRPAGAKMACRYCPAERANLMAGFNRRSRMRRANWIEVPGALVADCGDLGLVLLVGSGDSWRTWHMPRKGKPTPLDGGHPVGLKYAMAYGDDMVRRAPRLHERADWRERAPSAKQVDLARRLRVPISGSAGRVSDVITARLAVSKARKAGLL